MNLLLTVPAYGTIKDVVADRNVEGVRFNTNRNIKDSLDAILDNLRKQTDPKEVWVDLKCRQLRVAGYFVNFLADQEKHYIRLSHKIKVNIPTQLWMDDGNYYGTIEKVIDGDRLVVSGSVERREGLPLPQQGEIGIRPGMSINIIDTSLEIFGYLTVRDKKYIEACKRLGIHNYMLSFVERESDIQDLIKLDPAARIVAKIESKKGLEFVKDIYPKYKSTMHLMAARGDLYTELDRPHQIIRAVKDIIAADPQAIAASRIFGSLIDPSKMPACSDISDVAFLAEIGYKRFMLGDEVCSRKESVKSAIGLFEMIMNEYRYKEVGKYAG